MTDTHVARAHALEYFWEINETQEAGKVTLAIQNSYDRQPQTNISFTCGNRPFTATRICNVMAKVIALFIEPASIQSKCFDTRQCARVAPGVSF